MIASQRRGKRRRLVARGAGDPVPDIRSAFATTTPLGRFGTSLPRALFGRVCEWLTTESCENAARVCKHWFNLRKLNTREFRSPNSLGAVVTWHACTDHNVSAGRAKHREPRQPNQATDNNDNGNNGDGDSQSADLNAMPALGISDAVTHELLLADEDESPTDVESKHNDSGHGSIDQLWLAHLLTSPQAICKYPIEAWLQRYYHGITPYALSSYRNFDGYGDINAKMRTILNDWLIELVDGMQLRPATLFAAVDLVDRFLQRAACFRYRLQLVGICALWMASKAHSDLRHSGAEYVHLCDNAITLEEMLLMERAMEWSVELQPLWAAGQSQADYLQHTCLTVLKADTERQTVKYLVDLSLLHNQLIGHDRHRIISAASLLAQAISTFTPRRLRTRKTANSLLSSTVPALLSGTSASSSSTLPSVNSHAASRASSETTPLRHRRRPPPSPTDMQRIMSLLLDCPTRFASYDTSKQPHGQRPDFDFAAVKQWLKL